MLLKVRFDLCILYSSVEMPLHVLLVYVIAACYGARSICVGLTHKQYCTDVQSEVMMPVDTERYTRQLKYALQNSTSATITFPAS